MFEIKNKYKCLAFLILFISSNANAWDAPWTKKTSSGSDSESNGYRGIPWGVSYLKSGLGNGEVEKIEPDEYRKGLWELENKDINYYFLGFVFGVPYEQNAMTSGALLISDDSVIPKEFANYYDSKNEIIYIFYKGQFAMGFSVLKADNYADYKKTLSDKYESIGDIHKKFYSYADASLSDPYDFLINQYGNNGTEISLLKFSDSDQRYGVSMTNVCVLYGSKKIMTEIQSDIQAAINALGSKAVQQNNDAEKSDMKKLE